MFSLILRLIRSDSISAQLEFVETGSVGTVFLMGGILATEKIVVGSGTVGTVTFVIPDAYTDKDLCDPGWNGCNARRSAGLGEVG